MDAPPAQLGPATFRHDLVLHSSAEELAAVAVPFLRAGLEAGDAALIAVNDPAAAMLVDALGDAEQVHVLPRSEVYRARTPTAITAIRRLVERETGRGHARLRVVGETDFGRTPREWLEWQRYEAVVNEAMRSWPNWALCAFDVDALPEELIDCGLRTHTHLVSADGRRPNPDYTEPADYLRALPVPSEPLEATEALLRVDDVWDFAGLRHAVGARLAQLDGSRDALDDLHLAVDEMSANAVRHGGPPVRLRLWASADRVVCTISDGGVGMDDPFAGYGPAHGDDLSHGGMGLWLARQLCDHVDVVDGPDGLTVRLTTLLR